MQLPDLDKSIVMNLNLNVMNKHHLTYRTSTEPLSYRISKFSKPLSIGKTYFIWDQTRCHLILIMESDQKFNQEVKVFLKENRLILEAPLVSSFEKPCRTHLIDRETMEEIEMGIVDIDVAETNLNPGYKYSMISFQVIDSGLLKVTLGYHSSKRNNIN